MPAAEGAASAGPFPAPLRRRRRPPRRRRPTRPHVAEGGKPPPAGYDKGAESANCVRRSTLPSGTLHVRSRGTGPATQAGRGCAGPVRLQASPAPCPSSYPWTRGRLAQTRVRPWTGVHGPGSPRPTRPSGPAGPGSWTGTDARPARPGPTRLRVPPVQASAYAGGRTGRERPRPATRGSSRESGPAVAGVAQAHTGGGLARAVRAGCCPGCDRAVRAGCGRIEPKPRSLRQDRGPQGPGGTRAAARAPARRNGGPRAWRRRWRGGGVPRRR